MSKKDDVKFACLAHVLQLHSLVPDDRRGTSRLPVLGVPLGSRVRRDRFCCFCLQCAEIRQKFIHMCCCKHAVGLWMVVGGVYYTLCNNCCAGLETTAVELWASRSLPAAV